MCVCVGGSDTVAGILKWRDPHVSARGRGPPTSKFLPSEASLVPRCWTNAVHISVSDISGALPLPLPLPLLGVLFFEEDISRKINFLGGGR